MLHLRCRDCTTADVGRTAASRDLVGSVRARYTDLTRLEARAPRLRRASAL